MRFRFSLATLLICTAVLAVVIAVCVAVPVDERVTGPATIEGSSKIYRAIVGPPPRSPTGAEVAMRLAWSAPLAILLTLAAIRKLWPE
jgi:hypothetical protein